MPTNRWFPLFTPGTDGSVVSLGADRSRTSTHTTSCIAHNRAMTRAGTSSPSATDATMRSMLGDYTYDLHPCQAELLRDSQRYILQSIGRGTSTRFSDELLRAAQAIAESTRTMASVGPSWVGSNRGAREAVSNGSERTVTFDYAAHERRPLRTIHDEIHYEREYGAQFETSRIPARRADGVEGGV